MSYLRIAESFYVGVHDLSASTVWYTEKLGLKKAKVELDEPEGCIGLVFPKELPTAIVLGPLNASANAATRMLYTGDIEGARKWLNSRGVDVGAIEADRQGTRYFAMRDLEGNAIEISEEP